MKHFEIYKKDPATGALYPEGQRRKKGLARILEIVVRDFWQLLGSGLIATAAVPAIQCSGTADPFLCCHRRSGLCLRDEPAGYHFALSAG